MNRLPWLLMLLAATVAAEPAPKEFGYAAPLSFEAGSALYVVTLNESVYRRAARPDLGDLRVFNAAGEAVPFALRAAPPAPPVDGAAVPLPIFPVWSFGTDDTTRPLRIEIDRDGNVRVLGSGGTRRDATVTAWLVDASAHSTPMAALELTLASDADVISRLSVEGSDDLETWTALASNAPLVRTRFAGQQLERTRIEFAPTRARYLRLSGGDALPRLAGVAVRPPKIAEARPEIRAVVEPTDMDRAAGVVRYDIAAALPMRRVAVQLGDDNAVLPFVLEAETRNGSWIPVANGTAYRLMQNGVALDGEPVDLRDQGRKLRLRSVAPGTSVGSSPPRLVLHWTPVELVFAARGAAPFTVHYGHGRAEPVALPIASLVPGYGTDAALQPKSATLGTEIEIAGPHAADPPADWKRWLLWAVLAGAVVLLIAMGYRLAREAGRAGT
ncbi:MAG: DUF3999 domain-containing protein [Burkholderiales bacterium]|nr:DUF3999 domain-containing protein [Burkholderiales bacterium]